MKRELSVAILAAVIGVGGITSVTYAAHDNDDRNEDRDHNRDTRDQREYRQVLSDLKEARRILTTVPGDWDGRRKQALTQTNYAIEQVYAALGDDAAKAKDHEEAQRLAEEGRNHRDRDMREGDRRSEMRSAVDHLGAARTRLDRISPDDSRRPKVIEFTTQALKDAQAALSTLK